MTGSNTYTDLQDLHHTRTVAKQYDFVLLLRDPCQVNNCSFNIVSGDD